MNPRLDTAHDGLRVRSPAHRRGRFGAVLGLLCAALLVSLSGCKCSPFCLDQWVETRLKKNEAKLAFDEAYHPPVCADYHKDYSDGWRAGYLDVAQGWSGVPPVTPPYRYQTYHYQSAHGKQAAHAWYLGFAAGANSAKCRGLNVATRVYSIESQSCGCQGHCLDPVPGVLPVLDSALVRQSPCQCRGLWMDGELVEESIVPPEPTPVPPGPPAPPVDDEGEGPHSNFGPLRWHESVSTEVIPFGLVALPSNLTQLDKLATPITQNGVRPLPAEPPQPLAIQSAPRPVPLPVPEPALEDLRPAPRLPQASQPIVQVPAPVSSPPPSVAQRPQVLVEDAASLPSALSQPDAVANAAAVSSGPTSGKRAPLPRVAVRETPLPPPVVRRSQPELLPTLPAAVAMGPQRVAPHEVDYPAEIEFATGLVPAASVAPPAAMPVATRRPSPARGREDVALNYPDELSKTNLPTSLHVLYPIELSHPETISTSAVPRTREATTDEEQLFYPDAFIEPPAMTTDDIRFADVVLPTSCVIEIAIPKYK